MLHRLLHRLSLNALLIAAASAHAELPEAVAQLLRAANIPEQAVGVVVMRDNTTLLSHGAERSMQPASTMKLVTTLVGLEQLGPAFRGRTELRSSADLISGVLKGDLILRGGADADLNADVLQHMLQTLRNQGIKKISGDLILDRQLFQPARPDLGLAPFDENPEFRYNVIPDALLLNTNLLQIDLIGSGKQLKLIMRPALEKVTLGSDMTLIEADCANWEDGWRAPDTVRDGNGNLRVMLHGVFPKNCTTSTSINVLDRHDYADRLFRTTWRRLGGEFNGIVRAAPTATPPYTRLLTDHVARALPEMVRDINKSSDNTLARLLFLSLGSLEADPFFGSRPLPTPATSPRMSPTTSAARSELLIRQWLQRHDIDDQGLVLENGSGLSRIERIRPAQMAGLLQAASHSPWAPEFLASLPIAALDGTMRRRLHDSPAAARARIKTGTLKNVVAIAGYVPDTSGQQCVVVAMINHELAGSGGRAALDALIDWVAQSGI